MKIAAASNTAGLDGTIHESFESSGYILIIETDDGTFEVCENTGGSGGDGAALAREIVRRRCEALISGTLEKDAFEILAGDQVTRYYGAGLDIREALKLMDAYRLELIRVPNGEVWVPHDHDGGECNCGEDHGE